MCRYYFHFAGPADDIALDEEGSEFLNDAAAMQYAMLTALGLVAEFVSEGNSIDGQRVEVTDDFRRVGSIELVDAVRARSH